MLQAVIDRQLQWLTDETQQAHQDICTSATAKQLQQQSTTTQSQQKHVVLSLIQTLDTLTVAAQYCMVLCLKKMHQNFVFFTEWRHVDRQ